MREFWLNSFIVILGYGLGYVPARDDGVYEEQPKS